MVIDKPAFIKIEVRFNGTCIPLLYGHFKKFKVPMRDKVPHRSSKCTALEINHYGLKVHSLED